MDAFNVCGSVSDLHMMETAEVKDEIELPAIERKIQETADKKVHVDPDCICFSLCELDRSVRYVQRGDIESLFR